MRPRAAWRVCALILAGAVVAGCVIGAGPTEPPSQAEIAAATETAAAQPAVVSFLSEDGVSLSGTLHSGDTSQAVVLLAHMRPSDQASWRPFAELVAEAGYAAFTFDFRGYGASGGSKQFGLIDRDVRAAIVYLRGAGYQSIVLIGASMGGVACAKNSHEANVTGLAMLSSPRNFEGLSVLEADVTGLTYPKLFIAAQDDEPAATDLRTLHAAASDPKDITLYTGSDHGTNLFNGVHKADLEQLLLDFIGRAAQAT